MNLVYYLYLLQNKTLIYHIKRPTSITMTLSIMSFLLILPYLGLAAPITQESDFSKRGWIPPSIKDALANTKTAIKNPNILKPVDSNWVDSLVKSQRQSFETMEEKALSLSNKVTVLLAKDPKGSVNSKKLSKAKKAYDKLLALEKANKMDVYEQGRDRLLNGVTPDVKLYGIDAEYLSHMIREFKPHTKPGMIENIASYGTSPDSQKLRVKNNKIHEALASLESQRSDLQKENDAVRKRMEQIRSSLVKSNPVLEELQ